MICRVTYDDDFKGHVNSFQFTVLELSEMGRHIDIQGNLDDVNRRRQRATDGFFASSL
jgi:hypothetical protein